MAGDAIETLTGMLERTSLPAQAAGEAEPSATMDRRALSRASPTDLRRVSAHEAAHAVVACMMGLQVVGALIREDGTGVVTLHVPAGPDDSADLSLGRILAHLAAPALELDAGADPLRRAHIATSKDLQQARAEIEQLRRLAPDWQLSMRCLASLAHGAVTANLRPIRSVAALLVELGEIDGPTVAALCGLPN
jgi:hypothetical protein